MSAVEAPSPAVESAEAEPKKANVGSGLAFITMAKLYFIVSGFAVQVGLPRLLGSPEAFGQFSLAMSIANVVDNVLIATTVQSLSKRVSENEQLAPARLRQGLRLQLLIGFVISTSLMLTAPLFAKAAYEPGKDLILMLRIAGIVPFCYALYAALVGTLNGQRKFRKQATLDVTFSTVRTIGILGAAGLGFGALGALSGFAAAAFVILTVALFVVGIGKPGELLPLRTWFGFLVPIALFQLMLNGMLLMDVWMLQNTAAELLIELGHTLTDASTQAKALVGNYRAAQNFALVPYQVIMSVTFVVFPLVSRATASGDMESAKVHIGNALRFSLIVLFGLAAPIAGASEGLIRLAYKATFLPGASALPVLVFGQLSLSIFVIIATVLSGAGRPIVSAVTGLVALVLMYVANRTLVRMVGIGDQTLVMAAFATSLGSLLAALLANFTLRRMFAVGVPVGTLLRCAASGLAAFAIARLIPQTSALLGPVVMVAGGVLYLVALFVTRELTRADVASALAMLKKRRAKA